MKIFKYVEEYELRDIITLIRAETIERARQILIDRDDYNERYGKLSEIEFDSDGVSEL